MRSVDLGADTKLTDKKRNSVNKEEASQTKTADFVKNADTQEAVKENNSHNKDEASQAEAAEVANSKSNSWCEQGKIL